MLLLAPVTIEVGNIMGIDPVPLLMAEMLFSNVGGTSTMIGDPPNIIIGNTLSSEVNFWDFIANLLPCILLCAVSTFIFLRYEFREYLSTGTRM